MSIPSRSDAGLPASDRLAKNLSFAAAYRIADARLHPQPAESVEKLCLDGAAVPLQIPASYGYRRFPHTAGYESLEKSCLRVARGLAEGRSTRPC